MRPILAFLSLVIFSLMLTGITATPSLQIELIGRGTYTEDWAFNSWTTTINGAQVSSGVLQFPIFGTTYFQVIGLSGCFDWKCAIESKSTLVSTLIEVKAIYSSSNVLQISLTEYYSPVDNSCGSRTPQSAYLPMGESITYTTDDKAVYQISFTNSSQNNFLPDQTLASSQVVSGPSFNFSSPNIQPALFIGFDFPVVNFFSQGFILPYNLNGVEIILPSGCQPTQCGTAKHSTYTYTDVMLEFSNYHQNYVTVSASYTYSPLDSQCSSIGLDPSNAGVNVPDLLTMYIDSYKVTLSVLYQYF